MNERTEAANEARLLAQQCQTAVFSTISVKLQGHPFGSVSPVMLADDGNMVFYVSDIAQHARNLDQDPRLSLTLYHQASHGDQNEQGRLTLSGLAHPLTDVQSAAYAPRYFRLFPEAQRYEKAHDFRFWLLKVKDVRFIGGFGKIFWLKQSEWQRLAPQWSAEQESDMVRHMNADHSDACQLILADHFLQQGQPTMLSVYADGCHFMLDGKRYFVPFTTPCHTSQEVRQALVAMTNKARAA
ncbi:HugZ family pyridoxamine 5'-phosphate oxidase [Lacimicrobium alkaliphilum]|uniref:DUF2470 domain-containing protein n=1 Tax=Lacimicrobium alkaliphilum TaxID=1526571 RepID=A0ABQ1RAB7_9ALTE|nr:DUF2470 domain-containing protein [Lacimicrobium alkaliphilum]GGD59525.1 hypothetical protein GCM10011357_13500 [Lacimicrobium alkaliphilum]